MPDCPHIHIQDSGLQAFRAFIREETDGGQTIGRFLIDAVEGKLPDFQPNHRLEAAKMLRDYGSEVAEEYIRNYTAPKPRRSTAAEGSPAQGEARPEHEPALSLACPEPVEGSKDRRAEGRDPIIDPIKDEMARFIREETNNGQSIVRNLIQIMEAREDPYLPNHNLDAARQLTDYGFPVTGDLLCATECTHHAPAQPDTVEGDGAADSTEGETAPDPAWLETLQEIKRMEDEGEIDKVDYDPFKPVYDWAPKEAVMPYADEVAAEFRAELDLRAERRANWPEIEERRRNKHAEIYPSHSDDDDTEDPPDT